MKTQQMNPEQIARLMFALDSNDRMLEFEHSIVQSTRVKAKDRRKAQQANAHLKPTQGHKVSKGMARELCTQGGRRSHKWNDSGRTKMSKEGIELSLLNETAPPMWAVIENFNGHMEDCIDTVEWSVMKFLTPKIWEYDSSWGTQQEAQIRAGELNNGTL